mmetsp:Transcript_26220/g.82991  ORF Transcript_26220/g.82991 Transcript_26220/m.82991 type:complete len:533 (+) Transcript_26220:227-1825(+)
MQPAAVTLQPTPGRPAAPPLEEGFLEAILRKGAGLWAELRRLVELSGEPCEGNVLHTWNSWQLERRMQAKQKNLVALARALGSDGASGQPPRILEIGFNAGHSVCLMLLANPEARVVAFDLCEHRYTAPCAEALRRHFGADRLELHAGPSGESLPAYLAGHPGSIFDLLHVDGGHQYAVASQDLENCSRLARLPPGPRSLVVLDDTDLVGVAAAWADFAAAGRVLECAPPHALGEFKHSVGELLAQPPGGGEGVCSGCGICGAPYACGGCRGVRYCCEACARVHWQQHRTVCEGRRPPPLAFPALAELVPCGVLCAGPRGCLLAVRDLAAGQLLFAEPPLSWQPEAAARTRLCASCGAPAPDRPHCNGCGQATRCAGCARKPCKMCPELKITRGHVQPFTLLALDVLRQREARLLPADALSPPLEVKDEHRLSAAAVQRVGHFCSAVRWPDERAAEVLAALALGRVELGRAGKAVAVGYYPKFARLQAAVCQQEPLQSNARVEVRPTSEHAFTLHVVLSRAIPAGAVVHLGA